MNLPHPHPRTKIYRRSPQNWNIADKNSEAIFELILKNNNKSLNKNVCIFDLDGTVFDVSYRTLGIIREWSQSEETKKISTEILEKVNTLEFNHVGYSLKQSLENAGFVFQNLEVQKMFLSMEKFWQKRFFDGKSLLKYDLPFSGVVKFIQKLHEKNISIIYLSGRYQDKMQQGTIQQFEKFMLPYEENSLFLKNNILLEDYKFKSEMMYQLSQKYNVISNFENEYINIYYMCMKVPDCIHVVMDSHHSGKETQMLEPLIYRIQSFNNLL